MSNASLIQGVQLSFYLHAQAKHHGELPSEWLLQHARSRGLGGGSAFRAIAEFGCHGAMREEQFSEMADDLPAKVELLEQAQIEPFQHLLRDHTSTWSMQWRR